MWLSYRIVYSRAQPALSFILQIRAARLPNRPDDCTFCRYFFFLTLKSLVLMSNRPQAGISYIKSAFGGSNIVFFGPFNVIFQAWPRFVHSFGLISSRILYFPPEMRLLFKLFGKMIEKPAPERQIVQANRSLQPISGLISASRLKKCAEQPQEFKLTALFLLSYQRLRALAHLQRASFSLLSTRRPVGRSFLGLYRHTHPVGRCFLNLYRQPHPVFGKIAIDL